MKPQSNTRKERLAAALRENLRRRKSAARNGRVKPAGNNETDSRELPADSREPATKQP